MPAKERSSTAGRKAGDEHVDDLVSELLIASRVLLGVSVRSLGALDDTLTVPQFRLLVILDSHGEVHLNRLAGALGVNSSSAMRMVDRLLTAGMVTRRENPDNRRHVLIGLTPLGRTVVRRVTSRRRREIKQLVAQMRVRDSEELVAALRAFSAAAERSEWGAYDDGPGSLGW